MNPEIQFRVVMLRLQGIQLHYIEAYILSHVPYRDLNWTAKKLDEWLTQVLFMKNLK